VIVVIIMLGWIVARRRSPTWRLAEHHERQPVHVPARQV
jgi:hypothetical protein